MNDDLLTSALAAVRDVDGDDGELAAMTRSRLRRTLESRARGRRQMVSFLTMVGILFFGTVSWALSTGRTGELWAAVAEPAVVPAVVPSIVPQAAHVLDGASSERAPAVERPSVATTAPELPAVVEPPVVVPPAAEPLAMAIEHPDQRPIEPPAEVPIERPADHPVQAPPRPSTPARPARPVKVPAPRPAAVEVLYRKAHDLHFHGGDHPATLAAWDAYLATEPTGRFVVEARYNRALILIRLGRYAEARTALAPFAGGEVQPADYRRTEAARLVERLDDLLRAP